MPLTTTNRDNTLAYWWGLEEHKNTLIKWQKENTREVLIANRSRVYSNRQEIINGIIKVSSCASEIQYNNIVMSSLSHSNQNVVENFQKFIQLNLPHSVFIEWLKKHPHSNDSHASCRSQPITLATYYQTNHSTIPFIPEYVTLPDISSIQVSELKEAITPISSSKKIFTIYKINESHTFTKQLTHFNFSTLNTVKDYTYKGKILNNNITKEDCDKYYIKTTTPNKKVYARQKYSVSQLLEVLKHPFYDDNTPLSEFFVVADYMLEGCYDDYYPEPGDVVLEITITANSK
ncbi:hypothetical protein [Silvanigrella aquatica]|uniref:Uncharacterized protein n=1 Tax=Silvanigrella aquatica TaxID=1915309 RepID=A0A1L4D168_9BACT|nr:hypothetical protein [Silvanigrella aquatica]APJ03938.1 hypothetical protein AXG55_08480 [Silvanigrella aquatica]